jgi:hypothetical protein
LAVKLSYNDYTMQHRVVELPLMLRRIQSVFAQCRKDCASIGASQIYSCNVLDCLIKATLSINFNSVDDNAHVRHRERDRCSTSSERKGTSKNLLQTCDHTSGFAAFDFDKSRPWVTSQGCQKNLGVFLSFVLPNRGIVSTVEEPERLRKIEVGQ